MKLEKQRITHQREVILDELKLIKSHPTADELCGIIRLKLPRISLATVYRNLEWLTTQGVVQKIEVGGRQKRFDGTVSEHYHIRCCTCGKVDDVMMNTFKNIDSRLEKKTGYKILGHRLEFKGLCPACQPKETV